MTGMTDSAQVQRINAQCLAEQPAPPQKDHRPRYRHLPTNKHYYLVLELGGACELQGIDMRCIHQSRSALDDSNIWERLP